MGHFLPGILNLNAPEHCVQWAWQKWDCRFLFPFFSPKKDVCFSPTQNHNIPLISLWEFMTRLWYSVREYTDLILPHGISYDI